VLACVSFVRFSPWKLRSPLRPGDGGSSEPSLARKLLSEAHAAIDREMIARQQRLDLAVLPACQNVFVFLSSADNFA